MSSRVVSLVEQKRLQWAKEREEMVGLCGLWGNPKYGPKKSEEQRLEDLQYKKKLLPPIPLRGEPEEKSQICKPEEESETSGYLSDSPKHLNEKDSMRENRYNEENSNSDWFAKEEKRDTYTADENTDGSHPMYAMDRKTYKNYRNEKWTQHSSDSWNLKNPKSWWLGTPDSISSDDGSRLRWGDRGVGIGHLWEPVVHQPNSRLPQLESYRPTPRWAERGLRQADGSEKADILIIHHPDDDQFKNYSSDGQTPKNFLLGQNVRLTPEVIEERERKRRRALEHQNAIRQQLEDRERKRKEERLNKLREERLEEERIKREQETERLRMEEEQRRNKEKEEKEKRKEELMKEAIEVAERKAKEEKRNQRKHVHLQEVMLEKEDKLQESSMEKKNSIRTPRSKNQEKLEYKAKSSRSEKMEMGRETESLPMYKNRKDSSIQFEQVKASNVQFLNMNAGHLAVDGGLALVLDKQPTDNGFLVPPDGVQLALLMSPGSVSSSQIIPFQTPMPAVVTPRGRVLTPTKFRNIDNPAMSQRDKTTQTDGACCSAYVKSSRTVPRCRKQSRRSGRVSGGSDSSDKSNSLERPPAHYHCAASTKIRSRSQPKYTIDDRPKWGINRPSVQYKKQSEKDLYYQKRMRQRLKKMNDISTSTEVSPKEKDGPAGEEKLLESEMRLLKVDTDEDEPKKSLKKNVLKNGYRMNSNPSSPVFVPIDSDRTEKSEQGQEFVLELTIEPDLLENSNNIGKDGAGEEEFEDTIVPGSVGYVTQTQLEAIRQIASLKEVLPGLVRQRASETSDGFLNLSQCNPSFGKKRIKLEIANHIGMAFKLDDFLSKKKEPTQVLDLSKVKITSKEEFRKYLDKVPEFKIKQEKVMMESIKIRDKDFSFTPGKREEKQMKEWSFPDPTPPDMKTVKLEDLCHVNIDWKMLTTLRPKTKVEEEMFSRLVQLGKLDLKYQQTLLRAKSTDWIRKTKNPRSSIVEVRVLSCKECGEDFCDGTVVLRSSCSKLTYDNFSRSQANTSADIIKNFKIPEPGKSFNKRKKKRKSRRRKRSRVRRVKTRKNSVFNRPPTTGCSRDHSRRGSHAKAESMRSSSLNRIQSQQKPSFLKLNRSKSAPRLRCNKRETSDPMFAARGEYASDSVPTQTNYSSQSDSESYPRRDSSGEPSKGKHSVRVGFVDGYQSDGGAYRSRRSREDTSFSSRHSEGVGSGFESRNSYESLVEACGRSTSPPKSSSKPGSKYPTTIDIRFDGFHPTSNVFFPRKSYAPNKFGYAKKETPLTLKNQGITKIKEGFTKIDLSFMNEEPSTSNDNAIVVSPKRISSRTPKRRTKSERDAFLLNATVKGKGLFGVFLNRKKRGD